jgi:DNA-binding MarR family transcriptional regulator
MNRNASSFDDAALAARLHALAIHLLRRVRRDDPAMGLSAARASALSVLVFGGPRSLGELAAAEQVTPPTMTRLIAALEAEGYVTRRADAADRRAVRVAATAKGRRALEAGRQRRVDHTTALLSRLTARERVLVADAVAALERALADEAATP